jgi:hypothetical protein
VVAWKTDDSFALGDVEYVCRPVSGRFESTPHRFCLLKAPWQVEWHERLLHDVRPGAMIEVGMFDGASVALSYELAQPRTIIGIDNRETPSAALEAFVARRELGSSVRPFYGVDQTDVARLEQILRDEVGEALDLVVDDASHLLEATRRTFNVLFPRLRPSGVYVIEDWPMHIAPEKYPPLTLFVFELTVACADAPGVVAEVAINRNYVVVTRGAAELQSAPFDLSARYGPRARALLDPLLHAGDRNGG